MLEAYLRGLLHKNLPMGMESRLRENMILSAIAMEKNAEQRLEQLKLNTALIAPGLARSPNIKQTMTEVMHHLGDWDKIRQYNSEGLKSLEKRAAALAKTFNVLESSGILNELGMDDKLRQMLAAKEHEQSTS